MSDGDGDGESAANADVATDESEENVADADAATDGDGENVAGGDAATDGDGESAADADVTTDGDATEAPESTDDGPEAEPAAETAADDNSAPEAGNAADSGTEYAVPTETESDAETAWRRELAEAGRLTPNAVDTLVRIHDGRGTRAIEAVSEGRVKRYRDFTVVVGHEDEYVVEDGGCTCKDSSYNLDPEDPTERCWHVLAAAVAERIGEVDHHEMWYSEVRDFL